MSYHTPYRSDRMLLFAFCHPALRRIANMQYAVRDIVIVAAGAAVVSPVCAFAEESKASSSRIPPAALNRSKTFYMQQPPPPPPPPPRRSSTPDAAESYTSSIVVGRHPLSQPLSDDGSGYDSNAETLYLQPAASTPVSRVSTSSSTRLSKVSKLGGEGRDGDGDGDVFNFDEKLSVATQSPLSPITLGKSFTNHSKFASLTRMRETTKKHVKMMCKAAFYEVFPYRDASCASLQCFNSLLHCLLALTQDLGHFDS